MAAWPDLTSLIPARSATPDPGVFRVALIPRRQHLVGRDENGRACVLFSTRDSGIRAPLRLGGLSVQYALTCSVKLGATNEVRVLTVVASTSDEPNDERYFLHIMAALIDLAGEEPTLVELAQAVMQIASIFQKLGNKARESIVGVAGELVIIASANDPATAISAWRIDPDERYDFSAGDLRLEVKSSTNRRRVHGFSLEQCDVPALCDCILASVFIETNSGGISIEALVNQITARLAKDPKSIMRLEDTLSRTLGSDLPSALGFSFDYALATSEIAYYDLSTIPAVRPPLLPEISQVRFTSDVSGEPQIDMVEVKQKHPFLNQIMPVT
jgi:hypothetical protein